IVAVIRKPAMRTPRNMFIVNLAVADLLLCTVTMPLTLMEILTKYFPLGNNLFICKLIGILQATSTYVSTISITAIALDRYQVIVYPTKESLQLFGAALILLLIWLVALLLALPLFIFRHLAAYVRISYKLRYRFATGFVSSDDNSQKNRRQLRGRRLQRTNLLLGSIAIIFCISWLPLNVFNLVADLSTNQKFTTQPMIVCYAVCHMMGMSSACSNPVLYGCLNENFWKEFKEILCIESLKEPTSSDGQRMSLRKPSHKSHSRGGKPDVVTAAADYRPCNTVSSDMTVLTKC
ncbi:unnamed protein product, partial [Callosobruchus maculatus]